VNAAGGEAEDGLWGGGKRGSEETSGAGGRVVDCVQPKALCFQVVSLSSQLAPPQPGRELEGPLTEALE
jgi:hypothetical protein